MAVPAGKLELLPAAIRRRIRPDVDDDIPDGPLDATHNLDFTVRLALIVHASHSTLVSRERNTVLRVICLKLAGRELVNAKSSGEIATVVAYQFQLNAPDTGEDCWVKPHRTNVAPIANNAIQATRAWSFFPFYSVMLQNDLFNYDFIIGLIQMSVTSALRGRLR